MHRWLALATGLLALGTTALSGCVSPTDPLGRQDALEEAQQRYTDAVRWGELERAGAYVDPELRDEFMRLAPEYAELRITEHDIGKIEYLDEGAQVVVVYKGYVPAQLIERTARETQHWYREAGLRNDWRVRPELAAVLATLHGRTAPGSR